VRVENVKEGPKCLSIRYGCPSVLICWSWAAAWRVGDVYGAALGLALQSDSRWGTKVGPLSPRAEEELVEEALARFGETTFDLSMNFSGALEDETIVGYEDYELPQPRQT
jgi:hypothetical protein